VLPPSEMLVPIHQTTRRYIPEGRDLDIYPLTAGYGRDIASSKHCNKNTGDDVTTLKATGSGAGDHSCLSESPLLRDLKGI